MKTKARGFTAHRRQRAEKNVREGFAFGRPNFGGTRNLNTTTLARPTERRRWVGRLSNLSDLGALGVNRPGIRFSFFSRRIAASFSATSSGGFTAPCKAPNRFLSLSHWATQLCRGLRQIVDNFYVVNIMKRRFGKMLNISNFFISFSI